MQVERTEEEEMEKGKAEKRDRQLGRGWWKFNKVIVLNLKMDGKRAERRRENINVRWIRVREDRQ